MIEPLLQQLGLGANEIKVYLTLGGMGKAAAALIARKAELPRSSAYTVLESLYRRGLISREQAQEVTYYVANQPDSLKRMLDEERKQAEAELAKKESAALEAMTLLGPYFKRENFSIPKLQFFEGTTNVRTMLYEYCREWQKSIAAIDSVWWGYQDHHFVDTYREWLDYYWASMEPNEKVWLLSNRSQTEKKLKNRVTRRVIKVLPKEYQFSSTVWVLGDYVISIMTRQQPHYAFQLQDSVFAANQRLTFQLLWKYVSD